MLNKKNRLTKKGSFNYVYKKGESKHDKALILVFIRSKGSVRAGFSVSNKIGNATKRNKIKRRLRCAFREYLNDVAPGQLVFIAKTPILDLSYREISFLMRKLLMKAGLIKSTELQ